MDRALRFFSVGAPALLRLRGVSAETFDAIRARLGPFESGATPKPAVTVTLDVRKGDRAPPTLDARIPRVERSRISSAEFDVELKSRDGAWTLMGEIDDTMYAWETALRAAWTMILLDRGGFFVHAASACVGEGAFLFPGASGAGKTTLAKKAGPERMIGDDVAVVYPDGREWKVASSPFYSQYAYPGGDDAWRLEAIAFPQKRSKARRPLSAAATAARLLECAIFFCDDLTALKRLLGCAAACASSAPGFELGTTIDEPFDEIMERLLPSKSQIPMSK